MKNLVNQAVANTAAEMKKDNVKKHDWFVFTPCAIYTAEDLTDEIKKELSKNGQKCYAVWFNKTEEEFYSRFCKA